jgi:hypothetical protein
MDGHSVLLQQLVCLTLRSRLAQFPGLVVLEAYEPLHLVCLRACMHACLLFFLSFTAIPPGRRWFPTFYTVIWATIDDIGLCSTLRTKQEEELLYLFSL